MATDYRDKAGKKRARTTAATLAGVARLEEAPALAMASEGLVDHWMAVLRSFGASGVRKTGGRLAQLREALQRGVPRSAFEELRGSLGVSSAELADVLGIPLRTLARRTDRFKPDESERLLRVGSVVSKAVEVLEEAESVRRWMLEPKRALGGLAPLRACDTEVGAREVEALLGRIEHGVFS